VTGNSIENFSILVIDDDVQFGRLVQRLLQQLNKTAEVVVTGTDAVAKISNMSSVIVYLDVNLPDLPSLKVAEIIRSQEGLDAVIIGLSGHSKAEAKDFVNSQYIDFYEQKPMSLPELKLILHRTIVQGAELLRSRSLV